MIKLVLQSLKKMFQAPSMGVLLYIFSFLISAVVGLVFFQKALQVAPNSMEVSKLMEGFDFMTYSDFMRASDGSLKPIFFLSLLAGFIYFLLSLFLNGGVVGFALNKEFNLKTFFTNCTQYFPKFFLNYFFVLLLSFCFFLFSGILFFVFTLLAENGNDKSLALWLSVPSFVLFALLSFAVCVGDYSKILIAKYPYLSVGSAFSKALTYVWKNKTTLLGFWVLLILGFLSFMLYLGLEHTIAMTSIVTTIVVFILQQVYSFFRIILRYTHLELAHNLYTQKPLHIEPPIPAVVFAENQEPSNTDDGLPSEEED